MHQNRCFDVYYALFTQSEVVDFSIEALNGVLNIVSPARNCIDTIEVAQLLCKWWESLECVVGAISKNIEWKVNVRHIEGDALNFYRPLKVKLIDEITSSECWKYLKDHFSFVEITNIVPDTAVVV